MTTPITGKPTFGAGRAFMIGAYPNPTPTRAFVPQSQSIDFKRKNESLFGEQQFAVLIGAGEMEITAKVEYGKINPRILSDIMFNGGSTTGAYAEAEGEQVTVPAAGPYTVTVANAATFQFDLGVTNATTAASYICVPAGMETTGKSYSVGTGINAGKYTFAAGDASANILITYAFNIAASGETIALSNPNQGLSGNFQAVHVLPWGPQQDMFVFNSCIAGSTGISMKKSGFTNFTLDYMASVDQNNRLGTATFAVAA